MHTYIKQTQDKKKNGFYIGLKYFKQIELYQKSSAIVRIKKVVEFVLAVIGIWVANMVSIVIAYLQSKVHRQKNKATRWTKLIPFPNKIALLKVTSYFINFVIKSRMLHSTSTQFHNSLELETGNYNYHRSQTSFHLIFTINVQFIICIWKGECD